MPLRRRNFYADIVRGRGSSSIAPQPANTVGNSHAHISRPLAVTHIGGWSPPFATHPIPQSALTDLFHPTIASSMPNLLKSSQETEAKFGIEETKVPAGRQPTSGATLALRSRTGSLSQRCPSDAKHGLDLEHILQRRLTLHEKVKPDLDLSNHPSSLGYGETKRSGHGKEDSEHIQQTAGQQHHPRPGLALKQAGSQTTSGLRPSESAVDASLINESIRRVASNRLSNNQHPAKSGNIWSLSRYLDRVKEANVPAEQGSENSFSITRKIQRRAIEAENFSQYRKVRALTGERRDGQLKRRNNLPAKDAKDDFEEDEDEVERNEIFSRDSCRSGSPEGGDVPLTSSLSAILEEPEATDRYQRVSTAWNHLTKTVSTVNLRVMARASTAPFLRRQPSLSALHESDDGEDVAGTKEHSSWAIRLDEAADAPTTPKVHLAPVSGPDHRTRLIAVPSTCLESPSATHIGTLSAFAEKVDLNTSDSSDSSKQVLPDLSRQLPLPETPTRQRRRRPISENWGHGESAIEFSPQSVRALPTSRSPLPSSENWPPLLPPPPPPPSTSESGAPSASNVVSSSQESCNRRSRVTGNRPHSRSFSWSCENLHDFTNNKTSPRRGYASSLLQRSHENVSMPQLSVHMLPSLSSHQRLETTTHPEETSISLGASATRNFSRIPRPVGAVARQPSNAMNHAIALKKPAHRATSTSLSHIPLAAAASRSDSASNYSHDEKALAGDRDANTVAKVASTLHGHSIGVQHTEDMLGNNATENAQKKSVGDLSAFLTPSPQTPRHAVFNGLALHPPSNSTNIMTQTRLQQRPVRNRVRRQEELQPFDHRPDIMDRAEIRFFMNMNGAPPRATRRVLWNHGHSERSRPRSSCHEQSEPLRPHTSGHGNQEVQRSRVNGQGSLRSPRRRARNHGSPEPQLSRTNSYRLLSRGKR